MTRVEGAVPGSDENRHCSCSLISSFYASVLFINDYVSKIQSSVFMKTERREKPISVKEINLPHIQGERRRYSFVGVILHFCTNEKSGQH